MFGGFWWIFALRSPLSGDCSFFSRKANPREVFVFLFCRIFVLAVKGFVEVLMILRFLTAVSFAGFCMIFSLFFANKW